MAVVLNPNAVDDVLSTPSELDEIINSNPEEETFVSSPYITIGSLLRHDIPSFGSILPQYPTTSYLNVDPEFLNNEKYLIYDFPPRDIERLEDRGPYRFLAVIGNEMPILLKRVPEQRLISHWEKWVPGYEVPDIKLTADRANWVTPIVAVFPYQHLPAEDHAVNPDVHYWLLSKHAIPYMGTTNPAYMKPEDVSFPCMVKASHGLSCSGNYKIWNKADLVKTLQELDQNLNFSDHNRAVKGPHPVITEVVRDISGNWCLQFYLFKTGEIFWLGVTNQLIDETNFTWDGGVYEYEQQDYLRKKLSPTIEPLSNYLHQQGYYGFVGVDILESNHKDLYVVDVNPRLNGTTPLLLLTPRMARLGYTVSLYRAEWQFKGHSSEVWARIDSFNQKGEVRVVSLGITDDSEGGKGKACVCVFGTSRDQLFEVIDNLSERL